MDLINQGKTRDSRKLSPLYFSRWAVRLFAAQSVQWLGYGLDDWDSVSSRGWVFFHHSIQSGPGAHQASFTMGSGGSFPGGKAAGAWSWPPTSV